MAYNINLIIFPSMPEYLCWFAMRKEEGQGAQAPLPRELHWKQRGRKKMRREGKGERRRRRKRNEPPRCLDWLRHCSQLRKEIYGCLNPTISTESCAATIVRKSTRISKPLVVSKMGIHFTVLITEVSPQTPLSIILMTL